MTTSSPAIPDPTPAQIRAAAQVWYHHVEVTAGPLSQDVVQLLQAVLTAPTPYVALCRFNGVNPDARWRWEFAGDSYRRVVDARAAAAAATTPAPPTRPPSSSGLAAERSQDMTEMQTTFTTTTQGGGANGRANSGGNGWNGGQGGQGGSLIRGDVATVGRLQQAARQADALAEQVQIILGMVHAAASSLPDRLAAADWGTDAITAAGDTIGDAVGGQASLNGEALDGLLEQLDVLDGAVGAAEQLGAEVLARRADGQAVAFVQD